MVQNKILDIFHNIKQKKNQNSEGRTLVYSQFTSRLPLDLNNNYKII